MLFKKFSIVLINIFKIEKWENEKVFVLDDNEIVGKN